MAAHFIVPPIFKTFYKTLVSTPYVQVARSWRLVEWLKNSKTQLLIGYYALLATTVIGTSLIIDRTGIARFIMDNARAQVSARYLAQSNPLDQSFLRLITGDKLVVLVSTPDRKYVGLTSDGIQYAEVPESSVVNQSFTNLGEIVENRSRSGWRLYLPHLNSAIYNLEFSAKYPGTYRFTYEIGDPGGRKSTRKTQSLTIRSNEHHRYNLTIDTVNPHQSTLVFMNIFYRE